MDRFIADILAITKTRIEKFKIQYGQIYRPDEFILLNKIFHLKSNMDRFIDYFINLNSCDNKIFKIQYGQIYSL